MTLATARRAQTGVALITVLLVVFLASVSAASLATLQQLSIRRSAVLEQQQQARWYLLGAEQWALAVLNRDRRGGRGDNLTEAWAGLPPVLPISGGQISGQIVDLQGRFNLNNLILDDAIDARALARLQRLLSLLELDPGIALAIADWIDGDQQRRLEGAEDGDYLSAEIPYLSANRPFISVSELRLVRGIDAASYARLAPLVSALPTPTAVNVNTAPAPVLAALNDAIDLDRAEALAEERETAAPFASVEAFLRAAGLAAEGGASATNTDPTLTSGLDIASDYFLIQAMAEVGEGRARLLSVARRADDNDGAISVVYRSFGSDTNG